MPATSPTSRILGVLVTYRRQHLLPGTLDAVLAQTRPPDELFLVDNESAASTRDICSRYAGRSATRIHYLAAPENLGSAGGWALGMQPALERASDNDWILPLDDDDPPVQPGDLARIYEFALAQRQAWPRLGAVGLIGARFDWRTGRLSRLADAELAGPVRVDYVGSNHLPLYSARAMREVGVFNAELFFGFTELEYCLRLARAGYVVLAHGDMWRERRAQDGRLNLAHSPSPRCELHWHKYYTIRNYVAMMRRFGRGDLAWKYAGIQVLLKPAYTALFAPRTAWRGFRLAWRAVRDGFQQRMGRVIEPWGGALP